VGEKAHRLVARYHVGGLAAVVLPEIHFVLALEKTVAAEIYGLRLAPVASLGLQIFQKAMLLVAKASIVERRCLPAIPSIESSSPARNFFRLHGHVKRSSEAPENDVDCAAPVRLDCSRSRMRG
jgi:hypothetical protein